MRVVLVFLDGVGIGRRDPSTNPFFAVPLPALSGILGGFIPSLRGSRRRAKNASLCPISATLRTPGLPQSGTGQSALLTGVNTARVIGKHFGPYPYSTLRPIIEEQSLFRKLAARRKSGLFVNAFPQQYFRYITARASRIPVMSLAWIGAGNRLHDHTALEAGRALSADITNGRWSSLGYPDVGVISPAEAGRRLGHIARMHDFVLFEYSMTDYAGHRQSMTEATEILKTLDGFFGGLFDAADLQNTLVVITSDHGNFEDLSTKSHTRNPVPLFTVGKKHAEVAERISSITHVAPAIIELLN